MRALFGSDLLGELRDEHLDDLYSSPQRPWLRVNMISTLDGAATGPDGRSGGINNSADKRVFDALRRNCDAVIVGAGTARAEAYVDVSRPLVVVSRRALVPERLRNQPAGSVLMATCATAEHVDEARALLHPHNVLVLGDRQVGLAELRRSLAKRGLTRLLCEGGPSLFHALLAERTVDEVDLTWVPRLLAGTHPRITTGSPIDVSLRLTLLLEDQGTIMGRWVVGRA